MASTFLLCFFLVVLTALANGYSFDDSAATQFQTTTEPERPTGLAGGLTPQDLSDPDNRKKYTALAEVGLREINNQSNSLYRQNLIQVTKVYSQIVAGVSYTITFTTGQSTCRNSPENLLATMEACPLSNDANSLYQECTVKIWLQPWLHFQKVTDQKCKPADSSVLTTTSKNTADVSAGHTGTWSAFVDFMQTYNKVYTNETEMKKRYKVFKSNMKMVKLLQENEKGTATYGATLFSDMTMEEFSHLLIPKWRGASKEERISPEPTDDVPDSWDWRQKNAVTPIESQGLCLSCWAFAATANIEGVWAVKKGNLTSLSEQQLIDCNKYGEGCLGGSTWRAYKTVMRMGGLESERDYPYRPSVHHAVCKLNKTLQKVYINSSVAIQRNESQIAQYLYKNGPVAAGINVLPLMFYKGGIARPIPFLCHPKFINHAVTIVGYGKENFAPYWIIKNSFGTWWGEAGYLRLFRGEGVCGVDREVTSVLIS